MIKRLLRVSELLSLLYVGAAVSVCASDIVWKLPLLSDQWIFSSELVGEYRQHTDLTEQELSGTALISTSFGISNTLSAGVMMPLYGDYRDSQNGGGVGDVSLSINWVPHLKRSFSPIATVAMTIPTGKKMGGRTPRSNTLFNGDMSYYSNDAIALAPTLGFSIESTGLTYLCTPLFVFNDAQFVTLKNELNWSHINRTQRVTPELGFAVTVPVYGDSTMVDGISAVIEPAAFIDISEQVSLRTALIAGVTSTTVQRSEPSQHLVDPTIGISLTFSIRSTTQQDSCLDDSEAYYETVDTTTPLVVVSIEDSVIMSTIDSDGDGILDVDDQCVDSLELFNGYKDDDGCPDFTPKPRPESTMSSVLDGVVFSSGSTELNSKSKESLTPLVDKLKRGDISSIELRGYSDYSGGYDVNIKISQKRANAVRDYIIQSGVESSRITAIGYGANNPLADNRTSTGRAANRRIEYVIISN